ncbi:tRNA (uracil-5-)-methyltransferase [Alteromonadaceae bacterium Bs31]|nr:tRNA (uracil-5-)-methyltransferase [Alteromonadaceae bacterium Bs31]
MPVFTQAEYDQQLTLKTELTQAEFTEFSPPALEVFPSPLKNFRMRAEFKVWHCKTSNQAQYAMHKPGVSKQAFTIDTFPIASTMINSLMPALLDEVNSDETLKRKLFQAEFLSSTLNEALISLIYHKPLDETWESKAKALSAKLNCSIIGRSRKQKCLIGNDFIYEEFKIAEQNFRYQQVENSFTQPNASVCEKMLNWASDASKALKGDLLELYCGNGNFTLPLSKNFSKVLATEISKTSVKSAIHNLTINNIHNVAIARMSSEEFTQALNRERAFRRLKDIDLDSYAFSTIFVDPPRAGLDPATEQLAARFDNILYVSCNPATLKANLGHFCKTHKIERFALFDQFPYTEHRECGVLLKRL